MQEHDAEAEVPETSQQGTLQGALEAIIFAAGEPITWGEIKKIYDRMEPPETELDDEERAARYAALKEILDEIVTQWRVEGSPRGFGVVLVAGGYTFRSNPAYGDALRAMREQRPVRLSKPALETLAIVAYRQPVTKPEMDYIRGVDCGGTLRVLLDRGLVKIMGKRDEPGRPLIYGTTKHFLSFFNLGSLTQLPSLRDVYELSEESQEELSSAFEGFASLDEIKESAQRLQLDAEPVIDALDEAMSHLDQTQDQTRAALADEGITLDGNEAES